MTKTRRSVAALAVVCSMALTACGAPATSSSSPDAQASVTIRNCGKEMTYKRGGTMIVNDSNIIAMALAAGARPQITAVTVNEANRHVLIKRYGHDAESLTVIDKQYPSMEAIVARKPDVMVAGWNYGFSESKNMTPDTLKAKGIDSYILSESCRQTDGKSRGTMDPWEAVKADLHNLADISGHSDTGKAAVENLEKRLTALRAAPQPEHKPSVFIFDSAKDTIFTSGNMGGPQGIIDAAGARNSNDDVHNTWTSVGWEKIAAARPDVIALVEYPGQTLQEKIDILKSNPATKDLPAVQQNRFINLPYVAWCSGPMNIDAAETLRKYLEQHHLAPASSVTTEFNLLPTVEQHRG